MGNGVGREAARGSGVRRAHRRKAAAVLSRLIRQRHPHAFPLHRRTSESQPGRVGEADLRVRPQARWLDDAGDHRPGE